MNVDVNKTPPTKEQLREAKEKSQRKKRYVNALILALIAGMAIGYIAARVYGIESDLMNKGTVTLQLLAIGALVAGALAWPSPTRFDPKSVGTLAPDERGKLERLLTWVDEEDTRDRMIVAAYLRAVREQGRSLSPHEIAELNGYRARSKALENHDKQVREIEDKLKSIGSNSP